MYFPLLELHGWGKRPVIQPKAIDSEVPFFYLRKKDASDGSIPYKGVSGNLFFFRKLHQEGDTSRLAFGPDFAAVGRGDVLRDGQS